MYFDTVASGCRLILWKDLVSNGSFIWRFVPGYKEESDEQVMATHPGLKIIISPLGIISKVLTREIRHLSNRVN